MKIIDLNEKVGINSDCPCGSGKAYKFCCGVLPVEELDQAPQTIMGEKPTMEQWRELYDIAINIKKLAPWKVLWDSNVVMIAFPDVEEPVFCSTMGQNGECYGVGVYAGFESIRSFIRVLDNDGVDPFFITAGYQNCMMCYFGDREELHAKEREIIKKLDIKFRGRNEWIFFRSMKPGLYPWDIDKSQAELMIKVLENYYMACKAIVLENLEVNFRAGEVALRYYSEKDGQWVNKASKLPPIPQDDKYLVVSDELFVARLKAQKNFAAEIELDFFYLPMAAQNSKDEIPNFPQMALIVDREEGIVVDQRLEPYGEPFEVIVFDILNDYIMENGKPDAIFVRNDRAARYLLDLCQRISVELVDSEGVPLVDEAVEALLGAMNSGV